MVLVEFVAALARALGIVWVGAVALQIASTFLESAASAGHQRRVAAGTDDSENGRTARVLFAVLNSSGVFLLAVHAALFGGTIGGVPTWWIAGGFLVVITIGSGLGGFIVGRSGELDVTGAALALSIATFGITLYAFMPTFLFLVKLLTGA